MLLYYLVYLLTQSFTASLTPDPDNCQVLWSAQVEPTPLLEGTYTDFLARATGPSGTVRDDVLLEIIYPPTQPPAEIVIECTEGKIFNPNAPICPATCSGNSCLAIGTELGCVCPPGTLPSGDDCIATDLCFPNIEECPEGKIFDPNAPICPATCSGISCLAIGTQPGCVCSPGTLPAGDDCIASDLCFPNIECPEGKIFDVSAPICPETCSGVSCDGIGTQPDCVCPPGTLPEGDDCIAAEICNPILPCNCGCVICDPATPFCASANPPTCIDPCQDLDCAGRLCFATTEGGQCVDALNCANVDCTNNRLGSLCVDTTDGPQCIPGCEDITCSNGSSCEIGTNGHPECIPVTPPSRFTEFPWFSSVQADFDSSGDNRLKLCGRRQDQQPEQGALCAKRPKTCFFRTQMCFQASSIAVETPMTECFCDGAGGNQTWDCKPVVCPVSPTVVP